MRARPFVSKQIARNLRCNPVYTVIMQDLIDLGVVDADKARGVAGYPFTVNKAAANTGTDDTGTDDTGTDDTGTDDTGTDDTGIEG